MLHIWILWKRCLTQQGVPAEKRSAAQPRPNTGWREEDHSAPNIMSPVFPVPFLLQFSTAEYDRWEQPASSLDSCQMSTVGGGQLIG